MNLRKQVDSQLRRSITVLLAVVTTTLALSAHAEDAAPEAASAESIQLIAENNASNSQQHTLRQLGANYPMTLRGIEGIDSVNFDVRADQVVTGARLQLDYSYSPALLPDLSQLNVLVNDEVAATLMLPTETAGTRLQQLVEIPPHLVTEFNRLSLQLIGHYTMACEDPKHTSLWAKVSNRSILTVETTPLALPNDLARLPQPFFDRRDARALTLPFVFMNEPNATQLEAAGALSSWFGALASYRTARFPVSFAELPDQGHAVVLATGAAAAQLLGVEEVTKPTLAMTDNPNDPYGKLLVVAGADSSQLKVAAAALALGSQTLSGERLTVEDVVNLAPRHPYDAPNWLPSDRPVRIGELIASKALSVSGYDPGTISVPVRLPPDLFGWNEENPTLKLRYRYTPQPVSTNSSLLVSANGKYLKSLPLPSVENLGDDQGLLDLLKSDDSLLRETDIDLPLTDLPLNSTLEFRFMYDFIKQGECRDIIIDNMRGSIEPDSYLDLSHYKHFISMPNLGVFQGSGFPFTRLADLSETAVVLASTPSAEEIAAYLTVLGRFGESTGYPASAVQVTDGADPEQLRGKDLLVIAGSQELPVLQAWNEHLPAALNGTTQRLELSDLTWRMRDWLSPDPGVNHRGARTSVSLTGDRTRSFIAGFESPVEPGRSVVVLASADPTAMSELTDALIGGEQYEGNIEGSLAVVNGSRVDSLVAEETYHVGQLGWFKYLQWLLSGSVFMMLLATGLAVALLSLVFYVVLRAKARRRLEG